MHIINVGLPIIYFFACFVAPVSVFRRCVPSQPSAPLRPAWLRVRPAEHAGQPAAAPPGAPPPRPPGRAPPAAGRPRPRPVVRRVQLLRAGHDRRAVAAHPAGAGRGRGRAVAAAAALLLRQRGAPARRHADARRHDARPVPRAGRRLGEGAAQRLPDGRTVPPAVRRPAAAAGTTRLHQSDRHEVRTLADSPHAGIMWVPRTPLNVQNIWLATKICSRFLSEFSFNGSVQYSRSPCTELNIFLVFIFIINYCVQFSMFTLHSFFKFQLLKHFTDKLVT